MNECERGGAKRRRESIVNENSKVAPPGLSSFRHPCVNYATLSPIFGLDIFDTVRVDTWHNTVILQRIVKLQKLFHSELRLVQNLELFSWNNFRDGIYAFRLAHIFVMVRPLNIFVLN